MPARCAGSRSSTTSAPTTTAHGISKVKRHPELVGTVTIGGIDSPFSITSGELTRAAAKFLVAVREAANIYRHLVFKKGDGFIAEISMDETDRPQTPPELLIILAALAEEGVRVQTIAPRFTGRFNKGVDYVGDLAQFEKERQRIDELLGKDDPNEVASKSPAHGPVPATAG